MADHSKFYRQLVGLVVGVTLTVEAWKYVSWSFETLSRILSGGFAGLGQNLSAIDPGMLLLAFGMIATWLAFVAWAIPYGYRPRVLRRFLGSDITPTVRMG